jgi:hypothetical protein
MQTIEPSDRISLLSRLGYFIGEYLVQRLNGNWFLNELPDSRYFSRYVVGYFARASNPKAMVDPFEVGNAFIAEPPGRSLSNLLSSVEKEILQA